MGVCSMMAMSILAIIPARGGSKGIPRKNLRSLAGKPLLQYTAESALASKLVTRTILTTDDPEIAALGRKCGLEVPFMRPSELAMDDTPTLPVLQHAVHFMEKLGDTFHVICLLQPTSPLRTPGDIDGCISKLLKTGADSVFTILPVPHAYNPHWVYAEGQDGMLRLFTGEASPIPRRQLLPPAYHREGSVYVVKRDVLMETNSLYGSKIAGFPIERSRSVNIDTPEDWVRAEELLGRPKSAAS